MFFVQMRKKLTQNYEKILKICLLSIFYSSIHFLCRFYFFQNNIVLASRIIDFWFLECEEKFCKLGWASNKKRAKEILPFEIPVEPELQNITKTAKFLFNTVIWKLKIFYPFILIHSFIVKARLGSSLFRDVLSLRSVWTSPHLLEMRNWRD